VPPHFTRRRSLFLASIIVFGLVGAAELAVRAIGVEPPLAPAIVARTVDVDVEFPFMRADPALFWAPRPGFRGTFLGRPVSINALGLRGPELARPKPAGRRRLACFGDSITFGYGVADGETYAAALGQALGPGTEVINAGVTGYTTHQVRLLLARLAPALELDAATFCIGWNDASRRPVDDRTYAGRIRAAAALDGLARHVHLYRAAKSLYLRALMRRAEREWDTPPAQERVPPGRYRENLRAIVEECRRRGVQPVFLALPRRRRAGEAPPAVPAQAAVLAEVAAELTVPLLDVGELGLPAAGANDAYFIDNLHLSVEGHRYLASRLAEALRAIPLAAPTP
jgi:lysophospholipase L1-like esterase